jgi:hypothetical protein
MGSTPQVAMLPFYNLVARFALTLTVERLKLRPLLVL